MKTFLLALIASVSSISGVGDLHAAESAAAPKTELEGDWKPLSIRSEDEELPAETLEQMTFSFRGNLHTHAHKTLEVHQSKAAFHVDSTKNPKEMDLEIQDKSEPSPKIAAIYKIEGDKLTIVFDRKARGTRPKAFPKKEAPGMDVIVLQRTGP